MKDRPGAKPPRTLSALIVDDDLRMRQLVRDILVEEEALQVELCGDGLEAARILISRKIDILVTDLMMPDLDGMDLLDVAKHANPEGKIILITGYATVESAVTALKEGAFDYVKKPFEPDELLLTVRRAMAQIHLNRSTVDASTLPADC